MLLISVVTAIIGILSWQYPKFASPPQNDYAVKDISRDGILTLYSGKTFTGAKVADGGFAFNYEHGTELPYMVIFTLDDAIFDIDTDPAVSEFISGAPGELIDGGKAIRYKSGAVIRVQAFTVRLAN